MSCILCSSLWLILFDDFFDLRENQTKTKIESNIIANTTTAKKQKTKNRPPLEAAYGALNKTLPLEKLYEKFIPSDSNKPAE